MILVKPRWIILAALVLAIDFTTIPAHAIDTGVQDGSRMRLSTAPRFDADDVRDPAAILRTARLIYVCSQTTFLKTEIFENELLKRGEFQQSGLLITKDVKAADLVITIRRANFTTVYPYDVVDAKTKLVVASGKVNSLFGTAAAKIAKRFIKQVNEARAPASAKPKK